MRSSFRYGVLLEVAERRADLALLARVGVAVEGRRRRVAQGLGGHERGEEHDDGKYRRKVAATISRWCHVVVEC